MANDRTTRARASGARPRKKPGPTAVPGDGDGGLSQREGFRPIEDAPGYATPASKRLSQLVRAHLARGGDLDSDSVMSLGAQVMAELGVDEWMRPMTMAFLSGMRYEHEERRAAYKARRRLLIALSAFESAGRAFLAWGGREADEVLPRFESWAERVRGEVEAFLPPTPTADLSVQEYVARFGRAFALAPDVVGSLGTDEKTLQTARRRARDKLGESGPSPVATGRVRAATGRAGKTQQRK